MSGVKSIAQKAALLHEHDGLRTFVLVLGDGDEAMTALRTFAADHDLRASHFIAIGAFARAVVAYFDWSTKAYRHVRIEDQVEVLSLAGDITNEGTEKKVHAHVVLGRADATAHGGHLVEGHVRPTLELVITETPAYLERKLDRESGLPLIDPTSVRPPLAPGDLVPHFDVTAIDSRRVRYEEFWQHKNLVFVSLDRRPTPERYVADLLARQADFDAADTVLVISEERLNGVRSPGVLVADRWGEIVHVVAGETALPHADDLLEWVNFVRMQCPECPPS